LGMIIIIVLGLLFFIADAMSSMFKR
jgi:hypothetical protein